MSNQLLGALFLGMTIGKIIPSLPAPADIINPYIWIVFLILGIVFLVRS